MKENTTLYTFECKESNDTMVEFPLYKDTNINLEFDSSVRWPSVMYEFAKFLSGIYGYDIVDQVSVNGNALDAEVLNPLTSKSLQEVLDDWAKNSDVDTSYLDGEHQSYFMGTADDWAEE